MFNNLYVRDYIWKNYWKKIAAEMELLERDILPLKKFFEEIVLTRKTEALNTGKYVQITTKRGKITREIWEKYYHLDESMMYTFFEREETEWNYGMYFDFSVLRGIFAKFCLN